MDERRHADRLNQDWDALLGNGSRSLDPAFEQTLLLLHNLNEAPGPTQTFSDRLWKELNQSPPETSTQSRWSRPLFAVAASLALMLIAVAILGVLLNNDEPQSEQFSMVATPTPSATSTSTAAVGATAQPTETSGLAVIPSSTTTESVPSSTPTVPPSATIEPGPSETPTADPNATVPTFPTPPMQAGGGPSYDTLEQVVNAADLIVVARVTDEVVTQDEGLSFRAITIVQTIRGNPIEQAFVIDYDDLQESDEFVLFLNRLPSGPDNMFGAVVGYGIVPLADGTILPPPSGFGSVVRIIYANQAVDVLAADIAAIPDIGPVAEELLSSYGWTPIAKQSLWPRRLPEREEFGQSRALPIMPQSFEDLLTASNRIGLDFGTLAGQDVQLLVYLVERELDQPRMRAILAGLIIQDQAIVGAWVVVDHNPYPFGLDERDAALDIPAFIPTPEPTPTIAIPSSDTVNPAQLYSLADTETFTFCWPYCDQEPKTVGLRDAIVNALNQELTVQPFDVQPKPTQSYDLTPSDGAYVQIVFGYLRPGWSSYVFLYDRDAQLVLLPHDAGWVAAPAELVEIMAGIEPPPPPTKP